VEKTLWMLLLTSLLATPMAGRAQNYPAKPIRLVLTISGGGDLTARALGDKMGPALGAPILVEVQSAAGGALGASTVARAAPDGYTLLFASTSTMIMRPFLVKEMTYDTSRDFTPIAKVGEAIAAIVASTAFPPNNFAEMIDYAKRNPGKLSYSSTGIGTTHHLSGLVIEQMSGINWVHVPYKTGPQAVQDLVAGRTPVSIGTVSTFAGMIQAGKAKLIAINSNERFSETPSVLTIGESLPGYDRPAGWMAYFGPAGLPQAISRRVESEIIKAANEPGIKAKLLAAGIVVDTVPADSFVSTIKRDLALVSKLVRSAGIQPE
jgi:tripartite-type tricarboxylate transporter receptor subunit TctC